MGERKLLNHGIHERTHTMTPTEQMLNFKNHVAWYTRNMCANCPKNTEGESCAEYADCRAMACNALVLDEFHSMVSRLKNQPAPMLPVEYREVLADLKTQVAELKKEIQDLKDFFPDFQRYKREHLLDFPISRTELSVRARNCLSDAGIETVGELARMTERDIRKHRNIGVKTTKEIKEYLRTSGIPSVINKKVYPTK